MNFDEIIIQQLTKNDLSTLMSWASNEGWNPGKNDLEIFWNTDPEGFYGCFYKGQLIAGGAIISYNNDFGFMGLFIVDNKFRKNGIGKKLWFARRDLLISRLNENATIGMDGVLTMQPFYKKGGFHIAFRDERYELIGKNSLFSNDITPIVTNDFDDINEYDSHCFGYDRSKFLNGWLYMPEGKALKYKKNDKVLGYAVIRRAEKGYKIGPLFANNDEVAEELLKSCLNEVKGYPVYLDIPTINEGATSLVNSYEGKYVFECARMYYGKAPSSSIDKVYGITSFELG